MSKCGFRRGGLTCNLELGHPGPHWAGAVAAVYEPSPLPLPRPRVYELIFDVGSERQEFIAQARFCPSGFRVEGDARGVRVKQITIGVEPQMLGGRAPFEAMPIQWLASELRIYLSNVPLGACFAVELERPAPSSFKLIVEGAEA